MQRSRRGKFSTFIQAIFITLISISVAFGQTVNSYLVVRFNEAPPAETKTVYVDAGTDSAKGYADDLATRMAQRLSEQGLTGRVTVQSGYGCDAAVCVSVVYKIDGYTFGQEVKITDSMLPGNGPAPNVSLPSKPRDPLESSESPSSDAVRALKNAQWNYDDAQRHYDRAASRYGNAKRDLDNANQTLASLQAEAQSAENRVNSAIRAANNAKDKAASAGQRAAAAAQRASDRKTEFDRLTDYKPKLEAQRDQLANDLKKLENEVNQAASDARSMADTAVATQKGKGQAAATAARDRQKSGVANHNAAATSLSNSIALDKDMGDIKPDAPIAEGSQFKTPTSSTGGEKLRESAFALQTAKQTLDTLSARQREPGDRILPVAQSAIYIADDAYSRGDVDRGDFAIRAASALMEMAVGLAPLAVLLAAPEALALLTATIVSATALDIYQSWSGQHILSGEPLSGFEHGLAVIGVGAAFIPFESTVKAGMQGITRALALGEDFLLATKTSGQAAEILEAVKNAERFAKDSEVVVSSIDELQEYGRVLDKYGLNPPEWPTGIGFNKDLKVHMSALDGFTQKAGVKGCHNMANFDQVATEKGLRIISKQSSNVEGIFNIKYQIPKLDAALNPIPGEYKAQEFLKTVYDPKVYSDSEILRLAQVAAAQSPEYTSVGRKIYNVSIVGFQFAVYLLDGVVTNVHPI